MTDAEHFILSKPWARLSYSEKLHRLLYVHGWLDHRAPRLSRMYQYRLEVEFGQLVEEGQSWRRRFFDALPYDE